MSEHDAAGKASWDALFTSYPVAKFLPGLMSATGLVVFGGVLTTLVRPAAAQPRSVLAAA